MRKVPVDKPPGLWFNDIRTYIKDIDGNLPSFECSREPAVGVSRCGRKNVICFPSRFCKRII